MGPSLSASFAENKEKFRDLAARVIRLSWCAAVVVAFAGPPLAPGLAVWLFGDAYAADGRIAATLVGVGALAMAGAPFRIVLLAADRERWVLSGFGVAAALNVTTNAFLIPTYGALGATWATLLSNGILAFLFAFSTVRVGIGLGWLKGALFFTAVGAAAGTTTCLEPETAPFAWIGFAVLVTPILIRDLRVLVRMLEW